MRQTMKCISSNPLYNDKKYGITLGLNYFKPYTQFKNIYLDQDIKQPQIKKEKDLKIYYFDGFLKNANTFNQIKRIAQQYQTNLYYIDALDLLLYDLFNDEFKQKKNDLLQNIIMKTTTTKNSNSIFICHFDSLQMLQQCDIFKKNDLSQIDLLAICPYFENYQNVNNIMRKQFLYNFQKNIINIYSQLDHSTSNDYIVQKYMNSKDILDFIHEQNLGQNKQSQLQQQNQQNKQQQQSYEFKSLNVLLSSNDNILFDMSDNEKEQSFNFNLDQTYSLFHTQGYQSQYLLKYYSPVMSLFNKDPSSIILELILKDKFALK